MRLIIEGANLPGRACGPYRDIHVGLLVRREPMDLVAADSATAEWEVDVEVIERDGDRDFRGPAVQGKRGQRFVYLTWGEFRDGTFSMFRRAKLMLDDVPDPAVESVVARVDLTDECGMPRCARLAAPALDWR
jgi:hypothetical protein